MAQGDLVGTRAGAPTIWGDRRRALAHRILDAGRRALPADSPLELVLAGDAPADRITPVRVAVRGPDAVGRLLWPPSADRLAEAYLRGDIEIEGDIWTAIDAGRSFDPRRIGRDLPLVARLGVQPRRGAAPAPILRRRARLTGQRHSRARDLAAIRFHYDVAAGRARDLVGEEVYRTWRIYMAASRRGFEDGSLDVAQLLLARPGVDGPAELPLRPWWPG